ncbi:uncharacterized protein FA14DRAFT_177781 [Meira miltonrushii]|uniref:Uncharacterized protein n=1 Tax=Meira miltonrushii TaxID=1280837 RepID=A0A316VQR9_9BASI|nr:uncharacterized protein FA14DRAFT_177781 [Meira miltonrushii]PWN38511.1 hypothetical protein FA14DRAFT_177781 [Meira miltonrushii]
MAKKNLVFMENESTTSSQHGALPSPTTRKMNDLLELMSRPPSPSELEHSSHASNSPKSSSKSPNGYTFSSQQVPALFSKDVIKRNQAKNGSNKGHFKSKNLIAVNAEYLIKKKKTNDPEEAIRMAQKKVVKQREKVNASLKNWRRIAETDPSKAAQMRAKVPQNISMKLYVPARTHQLYHRGAARTMEEAHHLAPSNATSQVSNKYSSMLIKRQSLDKESNPKIPTQDKILLKAAELFFDHDDMHLSHALEQSKKESKDHSKPAPFTSDVLRRGSSYFKTPKGYFSNKNTALLAAETAEKQQKVAFHCRIQDTRPKNAADDLERVTQELVKRQVREHLPSSVEKASLSSSQARPIKKHKASKLSEEDRRSINAAKLFFSDENISLEQAIGKQNAISEGQKKQRSSNGMPRTSSIPMPFSDELLRNKSGKKPKGYNTNDQVVARHAERFMSDGNIMDKDVAIGMGKKMIQRSNLRKQIKLAHWRQIAETDPSKARLATTRVPTRLSKTHYIPLRAHQLDQQGKAKGMEEATQMATAEAQRELDRKRTSYHRFKAPLKGRRPK